MIDQINELPEDELKFSSETSHYTENKLISWKNQDKLYFLHLTDILNDLLLIWSIKRSLLGQSPFLPVRKPGFYISCSYFFLPEYREVTVMVSMWLLTIYNLLVALACAGSTRVTTPFFYKQSIVDPHPKNRLSFSKKWPLKIVLQLFSRWSINFYCWNILTFWTSR